MKKTTLFAPIALTLTLALTTGCTAAAMGSSAANASGLAPAGSPSSNTTAGIAGSADSTEYITQADAESIALADAGLTADALSGSYSRLEYDDGRAVYDVEFWTASTEYDYEIDAVSGEILSMDYDADNHATQSVTVSGSSTPASSPASGTAITEDAARQAALTHAGLAESDVQFVQCKLDRDDGRQVYDVEFYTASAEYDYEIDAATGEVLSYDYDAENYTPAASGASGTQITSDDAKRIALEHAGVAESDAARLKVELDRDDGRQVYEVEWDVGRTEYSYEINAADGSILNYETDRD